MSTTSCILSAVLLVGPSLAQEPAPTPKKLGKVFSRQVDGLISGLLGGVQRRGSLGGDTALQTAKVLTAMGHCHRFYSMELGPVTRLAVTRLIRSRQSDGSYADRRRATLDDKIGTTQWVLDALSVMDPTEFVEEIRLGQAWLADQKTTEPSPWEALLESVRATCRRDGSTPLDVGEDAAGRVARGPIRGADGAIDNPATVDALLELVACQVVAREFDRAADAGLAATFTATQQRGLDFLLQHQKDGVFFVDTPGGPVPDVGISGLGLAALQTKPPALRTKPEREVIAKGLRTLVASQNEDGSFGQQTVNYTTCAVVKALTMADAPEFEPVLQSAQRYILAIQNIEDRGYVERDRDYGSIGYGGDQRGDLSNLQMAVQALRETGLDENHEAFAKAIVFLQRTQNLRSVNDYDRRVRDDATGEWRRTTSGDDGGAAYYPGNSPAGYVELPDGTRIPRSYGSMTYALLKTYTLAGVKGNDRRVRAAIEWIKQHWTLDENPGADPRKPAKLRYQGLYYAYMVLAQALTVAELESFEVPMGEGVAPKTVDWRADLREKLASLQNDDGSWVNDRNGRWYEDQAVLCTIYALLALSHCET